MAVKPLRSVERAFTVLEAIAANMPIGVAALARLLDEDKSAVQRILVSLHASGWIAPTDEDNTRWKLTTRPLLVTSQGQSRSDTLQRVRPIVEALRDELDETVFMVVPDDDKVVIVDVAESRQLVRIAPHAGIVLPAETSAGGLAMATPGRVAVDHDVVAEGATSIAGAYLEGGRAVAAVVVSGPSNRMPKRRQDEIGRRLRARLG